jgi:hypothetical protein
MTWSSYARWDRPEAPLPLQIKATNWLHADEIDASNGDLIVEINEVIAGNMTALKN